MKSESTSAVITDARPEELIELLLRQIALAKQGLLEQAEALTVEGDEIVRQIAGSEILNQPGSEHLKKRIGELYEELFITLADKKSKTAQEIEDIRKGRKTIRTYRNNL